MSKARSANKPTENTNYISNVRPTDSHVDKFTHNLPVPSRICKRLVIINREMMVKLDG